MFGDHPARVTPMLRDEVGAAVAEAGADDYAPVIVSSARQLVAILEGLLIVRARPR